MKHSLQLFLMLMASLVGFVVYCIMWIDWVQDFSNGAYARDYLEAVVETTVLAGYTYLAVRFAYSRLNTL